MAPGTGQRHHKDRERANLQQPVAPAVSSRLVSSRLVSSCLLSLSLSLPLAGLYLLFPSAFRFMYHLSVILSFAHSFLPFIRSIHELITPDKVLVITARQQQQQQQQQLQKQHQQHDNESVEGDDILITCS